MTLRIISLFLIFSFSIGAFAQKVDIKKISDTCLALKGKYPTELLCLWKAYPHAIESVSDSGIYLHTGHFFPLRDTETMKSFDTMLVRPSLIDMLRFEYDTGDFFIPDSFCLSGRVRYEPLLKKMYGGTESEVRANLTTVDWKVGNSPLLRLPFNKVNGAADSLRKVLKELKKLPPVLHKYFAKLGGTFNWRPIHNTNGLRMSMHALGIAIDLDTRYGNYWDWEKDSEGRFYYQNKLPMDIVHIFERYGFIWGGRWYKYDTMHFEFRPELLIKL